MSSSTWTVSTRVCKTKFIFDLQESIKVFIRKLDVLLAQIAEGDICSFPNYQDFLATTDADFDNEGIDYCHDNEVLSSCLLKLKDNVSVNFPELGWESFNIVQKPFLSDAHKYGQVALVLAKLQADNNAKMHFNTEDVTSFRLLLLVKYQDIMQIAEKVLVKFGTMCICEAAFSAMAFIKNKYRSHLTNEHLNER